MSAGFIFGGSTGLTPEDLKRRRQSAQALTAAGSSTAPAQGGWVEGLARILTAGLGGYFEGEDRQTETAARSKAGTGLSGALDAYFAGKPAASAGAIPGAAAPAASGATTSAPATPFSGDIRSGIVSTAQSLGIDPVDLATTISYETAGTFDPTKRGPTTQWGQHRGLIQFGEPQAQQYGVDWNDPVGSQLGPDGAVARYLRSTGVKPGMGLMDIYSAVNAGGVGRYNRSDAGNGGAPGTVADKVNNQMSGHRAKALALIGDPTAQPTQVASLDPSAGMDAAMAYAPAQQRGDARQAIAGLLAGSELPKPLPAPRDIGPATVPTPSSAPREEIAALLDPWSGMREGDVRSSPVQVAQAAPGSREDLAGLLTPPTGTAPTTAGGMTPAMLQVLDALQNPWLTDSQRATGQFLLEEEMRAQQTAEERAFDARKAEAARRAGIEDYRTKQEIDREFAAPTQFRQASPEEAAAFGAPSGQFGPDGRFYPGEDTIPDAPSGYRYSAGGNLEFIPGGPQDPSRNPPKRDLVTIYDEQGREQKGYFEPNGSFVNVGGPKAGAEGGLITLPDGTRVQTGKPLTEGQSKDAVFSTRAAGALEILDKHAQALAGRWDGALGAVPWGYGREFQSTDFQLAQQSGDEFLQAILRKDTGAAITEQEQALYGATYLPRPGDSEALLKQKKMSRTRAVEAIKAGMPPAAIVAQELALRETEAASSAGLPDGVSEEDIAHTMKVHGMTREQVLERLRNAP